MKRRTLIQCIVAQAQENGAVYRKFFRHQYPGALMWLVTVGVWLRFGLVAANVTARHVFAQRGFRRG